MSGIPTANAFRVSWLLPVRDEPERLPRALASILPEFGPDDEVIVVDDGSREPVRVAAELARAFERRLRIHRTAPRGIAEALEFGRARCRGRFIARLDADDRVLPGRLEAQLEHLARDPGCVAVGGAARLENEGLADNAGMRRYLDWIHGLRDLHRERLVESPLLHPAVTLRAEALDRAGGYRRGPFPEDYDLWLRLIEQGGRLAALPRPVVRLADHAERLTRTDARYAIPAFDRLRRRHLARVWKGREDEALILWAGRSAGRPWLRALHAAGYPPAAVVDPFRAGRRQGGHVILAPDQVLRRPFSRALVAVGRPEARPLVRTAMERERPDLIEGRDWFFVR